jgi:DmsE family decaheme c-type cytochrome
MKTALFVITTIALAGFIPSAAAEPASSTGTVTERIPDVLAPAAAPAAAPAPDLKGAVMVGREVCATCHAEKAEGFDKTFHGRKSLSNPKLANTCESCHGAGSLHAESGDPALILNPKKLDSAATAALCMTCHKDKALMMWKTGAHNQNNLSCVTCHSVHEGEGRKSLKAGGTETCLQCHKKQKADMQLASHHPVLEGKMTCVSCHNPHGGIEGNLKADSVIEQCATCHSEKVGPFANEHPPVTDGCNNCHAVHGSANDRLLKMPVQILCMSCHNKNHTSFGTTAATTKAVWEQRERCTDCHREIHGSDRAQNFRK